MWTPIEHRTPGFDHQQGEDDEQPAGFQHPMDLAERHVIHGSKAGSHAEAEDDLREKAVQRQRKLRDERIPYEVPERAELSARLESVLSVLYLIFNEGYSATRGASLLRDELCTEAIRLARLLTELMPEPEVSGLLALMLLHEARRGARPRRSRLRESRSHRA